ncbi:MAG: hypothetical protein HFF76_08385 [Oscillospiraceae bacterium]|nr:hypothetical protein [Oscillospiraceae bacterium]
MTKTSRLFFVSGDFRKESSRRSRNCECSDKSLVPVLKIHQNKKGTGSLNQKKLQKRTERRLAGHATKISRLFLFPAEKEEMEGTHARAKYRAEKSLLLRTQHGTGTQHGANL